MRATPSASVVGTRPRRSRAREASTRTFHGRNESCPGAISGLKPNVRASGADAEASARITHTGATGGTRGRPASFTIRGRQQLRRALRIAHDCLSVSMPPRGTQKKVAPKLIRTHDTLPLRDGKVRIAVVADTHSAPHPRTLELLRAAAPDAILHAGDIGDLAVLDELATVARVVAVRGNIDERANDLPDELTLDLVNEEGKSALRLLLTHIAVYGPKLRADVAQRARGDHASMVVCGHSHVPFIGRDKGLVVFNPGSVGPRRFHLPIVFGMMEVKDGKLDLHHVSCESGARWEP